MVLFLSWPYLTCLMVTAQPQDPLQAFGVLGTEQGDSILIWKSNW